MDLEVKTTILLTRNQYDQLRRLAKQKKRSMGDLIRSACEKEYGIVSPETASEAVEQLSRLKLPVDSPAKMKQESYILKDLD